MSTFIIQLVTMSLQASVTIVVVLLLRKAFAMLGISKKYVMLLWAIPFFLLLCPWKISSPFGLWNHAPSDYDAQYTQYALERLEQSLGRVEVSSVEAPIEENLTGTWQENGQENMQDNLSDDAPGQWQKDTGTEGSEAGRLKLFISDTALIPVESLQELFYVATIIWLAGLLAFLSYATFSYLHLKKKVRCCIQKTENVFYVDDIAVPMVVGIIKPKIYLPSGMEEAYISYVVAHENTHMKRHDPIVKFMAYLITCLHWFNPLVWLAYHFLEKDMEMACDEETIQCIGTEKKKEYATALLQLAMGTRTIFAVPLAFGEGDTKGRIKNVMNYKKTVKAAAILAVAAGLLVLAVFMTKGEDSMALAGDTEMQAGADAAIGTELQAELSPEELAELEALEQQLKEEEARVQEELLAEIEEVERQALILEMNEQSELTFAMVREAEAKHILHELDFHGYANGENKKEEQSYSSNYYINFYFDYEGEEYRLGVSCWLGNDELDSIYITRISDGEMCWLYDGEVHAYSDMMEAFLVTKISVDNWLTVELPEGYTLGAYNANLGIAGGALISPQAYEVYGEVSAPQEWYYAGFVGKIPYAGDYFTFENGELVRGELGFWNHTLSEQLDVLDLDWQALFRAYNHDLYTAAGMAKLEGEGIDITQIDTTSDYWYFFFAKEGEEDAYYLSLSAKDFTKEEAIAIAKTVNIVE